MKQWMIKSPIGNLYIVFSDKGLKEISWRRQPIPMAKSVAENLVLRNTVVQLEEYFKGKRKTFEIPLDVEGTSFQKRVWKALTEIPYGTTCSYRDIARKIRNAKAVRAVGTANGRNPLGIIVPCHRVIAADGTLGGYAGGLHKKKRLLALEQEASVEKTSAR